MTPDEVVPAAAATTGVAGVTGVDEDAVDPPPPPPQAARPTAMAAARLTNVNERRMNPLFIFIDCSRNG
jgi:hypothetical protein